MNFIKEIEHLKIPNGSYLIVGSGLLNALGIRESNDIDLLVSKEVFEELVKRKWKIVTEEDGTKKISRGIFDCMTDWYGKDLATMLDDAQYIDNIPYMSLYSLYEWKKNMKRPKDLVDVRLIDEYLLEEPLE